MARILTINGSSHSENKFDERKRSTSLEIRDIERRLQRLNVIQARPRFHLLTPQKTKEDQGVLMYAECNKACRAFVLLYCTFKFQVHFWLHLLHQILKEVYITVSICKRATFIVVSIRFPAKCLLVFIKHLANSKTLKMYGKFTMSLDIDRQFAVHHEGECLTFIHGKNNEVNICVQFFVKVVYIHQKNKRKFLRFSCHLAALYCHQCRKTKPKLYCCF